MADYVATLKNDLVEQFRGKANIEALMEVIGAELQQVYDFYDQLRQDRGVHTAVGKQLDGVGDIVVMTRMEAGKLAGDPIPFEVIDDETYRRYLIYKILKNTCDCTYPDIIKAFRMFWDRPLYYKEDPAEPATMIFDTGEMDGTVDTTPLFTTPLLRAAGVTLKLYARTKTEMETAKLYILSGLGFAVTETLLPILERDIDYRAHVYVRGGYPISIALELDADVQITYNPGAFITSAEAEELVRTMVQEAISGVGTAIIKDITIPHTGWTWQEENPDEQGAWDMDEYRYYVDVPVTEAAETQFPNVALHKAALETAKNAGLCPTVQTLAGALRFWAKRSPDEDMEATIALVSPGASSSGGGGGSTYVLPVATATRLGGVKIGKGISVAADGTITASTSGVSPDDMASTEDTESMLDEVFPSEDENP